MKPFIQVVLIAMMAFVAPAQAVNHYSCNFEKQADRDRWVLNPTANQTIYNNLKNKWYIGAPGNYDQNGHYGLYISDDGGNTAHYSNTSCWVVAYDTVSLDKLSSEDYTLTFDYCGVGEVDKNSDGIYVLWVPVGEVNIMSIATFAGTIPTAYENYCIPLQPSTNKENLNGAATWKQCVAEIPNKKCDGTPHYLVFVWANNNGSAQQPGGMIDNIEIGDGRPCDKPTDLQLTIQGTTSILTWTGSESEYEVFAYSYEEKRWYGPRITSNTFASFSNLPIGQTDFFVRAKCADDLYSLRAIVSRLVYYSDQMCVDYLDLQKATCYIAQLPSNANTSTFNDFTTIALVDNGPKSMESRHTIHYDKTETEPRTGGLAKTIPDGEIASVRIGNWKVGGEAERIEYSFTVDTLIFPQLLIQYMPILEAPHHESDGNPRFQIDILENNQSVGPCVKLDYDGTNVYNMQSGVLLPGAAEQGWHITPKDVTGTNTDIVWKEWSVMGVNLAPYQGKTLTLRLTTMDCHAGGHFGYAYFTVGCSDRKLRGMKCDDITPVFAAPDGYVYRWAYASSEQYRKPDGSIPEKYVLGHNQVFEAGMTDDSLYVVDCMSLQDSSCFFSLYASTLATSPVAVIMNKPKITKHCEEGYYSVQFDGSKSWVREIDHVKSDTLVSRRYHIDRYEWTVEGLPGGWSNAIQPTFNFPATGGDYKVNLTVFSNICVSTISYNLHLDECSAIEPMDIINTNGKLLFREDFGGNDPSDPMVSTKEVPGISSRYHNCQEGMGSGCYAITKKGIENGIQWLRQDDHTYPNDTTRGYFLEVDGTGGDDCFYNMTLDSLAPGMDLTFSAYIVNVTYAGQIPYLKANYNYVYPRMKFVLKDPTTGEELASRSTGDIQPDLRYETPEDWKYARDNELSAEWQLFGIKYQVPDNVTSIQMYIYNDAPGGTGNDFAIDDIEVHLGWPEALDNIKTETTTAIKHIKNGQLLIEKNGKFYNALGVEVK